MSKSYRLNRERTLAQKEILSTLHEAAVLFSKLANKKVLFIYVDKCRGRYMYGYFEAVFYSSNFMHLCGFTRGKLNAKDFFDKCLNKEIKYSELNFKENIKAASAKLSVICGLLQYENVKLYKIGDKDLVTMKNPFIFAIGNSNAVMGFDKRFFYLPIPTTVLKNNISEYVSKPYNLVAVLSKNANAKNEKYSNMIGCPKRGIDLKELPEDIKKKIDFCK